MERAMGIEFAYLNSKVLQGKGVAPSPVFNWSQLESNVTERQEETDSLEIGEIE